jgi:vitamin B12 transporter
MKNVKKILILLGISFATSGFCQNKNFTDTVKIKEIVITSERIQQYTPGNKIQTIDSIALRQNISNSLSDIISSQTQIQINSYGKGALASPSFRGTGSAHTAVLWNGFNLQDILNGSVDFSQIPGIFLDDVKIQYGGCSALYGSGAIGGLISLNNKLQFDQGIGASVSSSFGSYSNYFHGAEFRLSHSKYSGIVRAYYNTSENNFEYSLNGEPKQKLLNAQTKQIGTLLSNSFKINDYQKITVHLWFQQNENHVPFDMMMMPGNAIDSGAIGMFNLRRNGFFLYLLPNICELAFQIYFITKLFTPFNFVYLLVSILFIVLYSLKLKLMD